MARRRWPRVVGWVAGLVAVALVAAALGAVWLVRRSFPQVSGTVVAAGLSGPVEVRRDAYGVPHVYADTAEDLFFAQGFVHAQDRFWEMDFRRHVTEGRLAELFGESQVETDAFLRTLGWHRVAEQELDLLAQDSVRALEAYSAGVNAYVADRSTSQLSLEYAVLGLQNAGYEVEPWTPVDSLAWLKAMAWDLRSNDGSEAARVLMSGDVGVERTEQVFPDYPYERNQPILVEGAVVDGTFDADADADTSSVPVTTSAQAHQVVSRVADAVAAVPPVLGPAGAGLGSNSWVLGGSRTTTGMPLLANDPHLGPSMPGIWYQMGLHCRQVTPQCPYEVAGYTFSGLPGVVIGHNADIAWGFTNLSGDVADLYLERIRGDRVVVDDGEEPLTTRTETVEVAGGEPVTLTVRSTRHGPLLSDVSDQLVTVSEQAPASDGNGEPDTELGVSLRWTGLDPGRTADAIFALNTARDFDDFRDAARLFEVPAQNLIFADTDGNIGYQSPGRFPIRGIGDGRWPAPGWDSDYDWAGWVPFEALPTAFNPDDDYISTANQPVIDLRTYPYWLGEDWAYGARGQRIVDLIESADTPLDADAVSRLHGDAYNDLAQFLVPHLLGVEGLDGVAADAQLLLDGWDYQQTADSAAGAYYNAVERALLTSVFNDELTAEGGQAYGGSRWWEAIRTLWATPDDPWWDDVTTDPVEDRDTTLRAAMQTAADEVGDLLGADPAAWRWGDLHTLELTNATLGTSGIAPIEWLFNRGPIPTGGGSSIVNATGWSATEGYQVDWVPSMRMVVDLDDLDASQWVNLTGASGHAFHQHYWDQTNLWRTIQTTPFSFTPEAVEAATEHTLTLQPGD